MIFGTKKSFDLNHDWNQWFKSPWFKSANPVSSVSLYVVTAIVPGWCGLASITIMSPFWILLDDGGGDRGGGDDNWSYKTCKALVKSSPPANLHSASYRPDALPVAEAKPTVSQHWRENLHHSVCINIQYGLPFWYRPLQVLEYGPLKQGRWMLYMLVSRTGYWQPRRGRLEPVWVGEFLLC